MFRGIARLVRRIAAVAVLSGVAAVWNSSTQAAVQQIIIDSTNTANYNPIPVGSSTPGPSTSYTIYTGRIIGVLTASSPFNSGITDLNLASGGSSYITVFSIVTPTNPAARSGLLIYEAPTNGANAINTNALVQGATYVQSGWQGDLLSQCSTAPVPSYPCVSLNAGPYGMPTASYPFFSSPSGSGLASFVIQVPVATTDGNVPNGTNTITGQVYGHVCTGNNGCSLTSGSAATSTAQLTIQGPGFVPYQPASLDTNQAQLWSVPSQTIDGIDGAKTVIPAAQWAWAYCPSGWPGVPNPNYICLNGTTFDPNRLYEVAYTAANPLVLGVGFAAVRDLGSFLRYGTTAPGGGSNPIAGSISKTLTIGESQGAAFLHGLIFYGFNEDESGRIVFDGAWPQSDAHMIPMNIRWGQPNNQMYLYMPGEEAPVWWADAPNTLRSLSADGMLNRCNATGTCPQILETFSSAEFYSGKMSVALCGFLCNADIPLPANVFRYYTPSATHNGGAVSFTWSAPGSITPPAGQLEPSDPIPQGFTNNALQSDFIQWLLNGTAMPASVYPTLAAGQLVPATQTAEGFPTIPGFPFAGNQALPPFIYNFGAGENYDQQSGIPTVQPPIITQVLQAYAPNVNADGNENVAGLPTVLGQAPLGTYVGWNLSSVGWYTGQVIVEAGGSGSFWPFYDTKANRVAAGDPRLSLEERYGTNAGYNCVVASAITSAVSQRFLLSSDATSLTALASASNVLTSPSYTPTSTDMVLANVLCGLPVGSPTVSQVSPTTGPPGGGTVVTITGMNFTGASTVSFGATPAAFTVNSDTSISATAPAGTPVSTIDITVTTPKSTSATGANDQFTYAALPPAVSGISPSNGPAAGGTSVTISGSSFGGATAVTFGATPAASFTVNTATSITATSPAGTPLATVDVTVTAPQGTSSVTAADQFTYAPLPKPAVTGISPGAGSAAGGTVVAISGSNFGGATAVNFGTAPAASFTVNTATSITATAPGGIPLSIVDVTVSAPQGTSSTSSADQFTYAALPPPSVSAVSPSTGAAAGGTVVNISGSNFSGVTGVNFGSKPAASFTVLTAGTISATTPAGTALSTVDVIVATSHGTSSTTVADQFTYAALLVLPPTVTGVSPVSGPASGKTTVTITGTNFAGATAVNFGSTAATSFTVNSPTSITAIVPASASVGNVHVTVTTPSGTSTASAADLYTYPAVAHDFNGDGKSDVLWRDNAGNVGMWLMNGATIAQASVLGAVPSLWSVVGQRDLTGSGDSDIIWRDTSGNVGIWLMNGIAVSSSIQLGNVSTTWSAVGTGDFNGDGKGDILWRNSAGDVAIWIMNGATVVNSVLLGNMPVAWTVAGADTKGNVFWRNNTTGDVLIWMLSGSALTQQVDLGAVPANWTIAGIGDFDGNGSTDVLWRDNFGNVGIWLMNGTQIISAKVLGGVGLNWSVALTGDYNGDGKSDIVWVDNAGNVAAWLMSGTTVDSVINYGKVGTNWTVQSLNAE